MPSYILIIKIDRRVIRIGNLGYINFNEGYYTYVGSAKRYLEKRIERHMSNKKKLHWHIDYLTTYLKPIVVRISNVEECELAKNVLKYGKPINRFGSSDCNCKSHLFYFNDLDECIKVIEMRGVGFEPTNP